MLQAAPGSASAKQVKTFQVLDTAFTFLTEEEACERTAKLCSGPRQDRTCSHDDSQRLLLDNTVDWIWDKFVKVTLTDVATVSINPVGKERRRV